MLHGNTPARRRDDVIELTHDAATVTRVSNNVFHPRLPNPDMPSRFNQHGPLFVPPSAGFEWPPRSHSSPRKPPMMSNGPVQKLQPRPVRQAEGRPVMLRGGGPKRRDELALQHAVDCQGGLTRLNKKKFGYVLDARNLSVDAVFGKMDSQTLASFATALVRWRDAVLAQ